MAGTPNKSTAELEELAQEYGPDSIVRETVQPWAIGQHC